MVQFCKLDLGSLGQFFEVANKVGLLRAHEKFFFNCLQVKRLYSFFEDDFFVGLLSYFQIEIQNSFQVYLLIVYGTVF